MPKQKNYAIHWEIELTASDHKSAAREALSVQRDRGSLATVFEVREVLADGSLGEMKLVDLEEWV